MHVLITCKNEEDPIKNEGARVVTTLISKALKGMQLTEDLAEIQTHSSSHACSCYLQE